MATAAIDILDLHWRILQGEEKRPNQRGRRRLRTKDRHEKKLSDEVRAVFKRNGGQLKMEGARHVAVEKANGHAEEQLDDWTPPSGGLHEGKQYSKCCSGFLKQRTKEDKVELDPVTAEKAIMLNLENRQRREGERIPDIYARCRFLRDFTEYLEGQIAKHGGTPTSQALLIEHQIELCRVESLLHAA